jgi:hypothetical protein
MQQFGYTHFAHPLELRPSAEKHYESALDASLREWSREAAEQILHVARQRLRQCEKAFTRYLGEDRSHLIENISGAERAVMEARARVSPSGEIEGRGAPRVPMRPAGGAPRERSSTCLLGTILTVANFHEVEDRPVADHHIGETIRNYGRSLFFGRHPGKLAEPPTSPFKEASWPLAWE